MVVCFKKVMSCVAVLFLLFICHSVSYSQQISKNVNYHAEFLPWGAEGIRKEYALPSEVNPANHFQVGFVFDLKPEEITADVTATMTFDQGNGTLQVRGKDGTLHSEGGINIEGFINIACVLPRIPFATKEPTFVKVKIPFSISNALDHVLGNLPGLPPINVLDSWDETHVFNSLLFDGNPVDGKPIELRGGIRELIRAEIQARDIVEAIIQAVTTSVGVPLPSIALKALGKAFEIALGNAAISYNLGFLSTLTLEGQSITVNGQQITNENRAIQAPGLDLSQDLYTVHSSYEERFTYQLDFVASSDVWLEFNPLGIPVWSYPKTVIAEFPSPIIPKKEVDLNFSSSQTTFPIVHAPVAQGPEPVGTISHQSLRVDASPITIDVAQYFSPNNNLTYEVSSNPTGFVTVSRSGSRVRIAPRQIGNTTVIVKASDRNDSRLYAIQTIPVLVYTNRATIVRPPPSTFTPPDNSNPRAEGLREGVSVITQNLDIPLRVREDPGTNHAIKTTIGNGLTGIITDGPRQANGYTWWEVEWDTNFDLEGWSVEFANGQVLFRRPPDLEIRDLDVSDDEVSPGETFTLEVEIRNNGPGESAATDIYFYYSKNRHRNLEELDEADDLRVSGQLRVPSIREGRRETLSHTVTAPTTPDSYYYGAFLPSNVHDTDYKGDLTEEALRNNLAREDRVEVVSAPDFIVESISVNKTRVDPGDTFTLRVTVLNQGIGEPKNRPTLVYYRSSDARITSSDRRVDADSVSTLDTDETRDERIVLTAPRTPGVYYYGACVENVRNESDRNNNCSSGIAITVRTPSVPAEVPDLVVGTPTVGVNTLAPGETFTLETSIENRGTGTTPSTTLKWYSSLNSNISVHDTEVGSASVSSLNAGGTHTTQIDLVAPLAAGTYYYGVCIDSVANERETNNNCSEGVALTVENRAPMIVDTIPTQTLKVEDLFVKVNLSQHFSDPNNDALTYKASSDATEIVVAEISGLSNSYLKMNPLTEGSTTITVEASDDEFTATQKLIVSVGSVCQVGDVLAAGESCTYPGTEAEFSVDNSGTGRFLFFSSGNRLNIRDTQINNTSYTLVAEKLDSGNWEIKELGDTAAPPPPTNNAPVFADGTSTTRTVAENTAAGINIGTRVAATDADNDTLTYTLGGTDAAAFDIDGTTGQLKTKATLNAATKSTYTVTITVSDGTDTATIPVTITVTGTGTAPPPPVADGICRVGDTLAPGESCTYSGTDTEFSVNSNGNGQFLFFSSGSRLNIRNTQIKNVSYTLVAEKLNSGSWEIKELGTPPLTTNNAPVFTEGASTTRTVAENTASGTNIGSAVAATDADSSDTLTYTLGGTDAAAFRIVSTSGQLQTRAALDYETKNAYTVTVSVSDGNGGSNNITVTINVTDVTVEPPPSTNNAPVFTEGASTTRTVAENTVAGINIGSVVAATDADNDILTYSLGGTNASSFRIVSTSGQLQTSAALDYETKSSYSVSVSVSDGNGGSDSITVTISVTDVVETGTPPVADGICRVGDTLAPGESCTYSGTDTEFSVNSNGNGQFLFFSSSSRLNIRNTEINNVSYTLVAEKLDSGSWEIKELGATAAPPPSTNNAPVFTEGASTTRTVTENTAAGINIGTPVAATDADNDTLTYTLGGTDAAAFDIDGTTGQLKTKAALDASTKSTYTVTITVSDGTDTATIPVTITVTGTGTAPPPPVADSICRVGDTLAPGESCTYSGTDTEFSINSNGNGQFLFFSSGSRLNIRNTQINNVSYTLVAEKLDSGSWEIKELGPPINRAPVAVGTISDRTLTAGDSASTVDVSSSFNDPNNDTLTYTATSSATGIATVSVSEAVVTITPIGTGSATITVTASDGTLTATQTISVTVAAPNRAPVAVGTISDRTLTAGGSTTTVNVSSNFNDPDNDTLTYTATSSATGIATVRVSRAVVTITPIGTGSATITVTASDGTLTATQTISVTVSDAPVANRAPVAVGTISDRTLTAGGSTTTVNVSSNFNDPDNDTLTYTATSSATGVATVRVSRAVVTITPIGTGSATITVTASDGTLTATQTIAVTVSAVPVANRAPVAVGTISDRTLTAGGSTTTVNVSSNFNDPDNDTLTYTATSSATGVATVSASDAQVTITPVTAGSATITVTASDGTLTATQTISVTVSAAPVANRAPVAVGTISARTLTVGDSPLVIDVSNNFRDPEGNSLSYTATSNNTSAATVSASGSQVTITPRRAGSVTITVTASDGELTATQTIAVTVTTGLVSNRAPITVGAISSQTLTFGDASVQIDISSNFQDPDNDTLRYTVSSNALGVATVSVSDSQVTITPVGTGSATIAVIASDGRLTATQTIDVTVNEAEEPVTDLPEETWMPDAILRAGVRSALGLQDSETLTQQTMTRLTSLSISAQPNALTGVVNLTGLEHATRLKTLNLSNYFATASRISNITPLQNLTNLTDLNLGSNQISDITPLRNLTNLTRLILQYNRISDITALENLTKLKHLRLIGNQISDVASIENLTSLTELYLGSNQITDLDPLRRLKAKNPLLRTDIEIGPLTPNRAPTAVGTISARTFTVGDSSEQIDVSSNFNDPDNDTLTYTAISSATGVATVSASDAQVTITPVTAGSATITVKASDGTLTATQTISVTVNAAVAEETWMPDAILRAAVRSALSLQQSETLTQQAMTRLTSLTANSLQIRDLTGLEYATNVTSLRLDGNKISDLTSLQNLTKLTYLSLFSNPISDITPLKNLTKLTNLTLGSNQVSNLTPLQNLTELTKLILQNSQISDLTPLKNLTKLTELTLQQNQISDITPLQNLTELTSLTFYQNRISNIAPLRTLTNLKNLWIDDNSISDITPLQNLTNLTSLRMRSNGISNITPLQSLTKLTFLIIDANSIKNITALQNLTKLTVLQLDSNQISDITLLQNLTKLVQLDIRGNQISDVTTLESLTALRNLLVLENPISDYAPLNRLKAANSDLNLDIDLTNNIPTFTEGDSTTRTVAENTTSGVNIGNAISATDADDHTLTYRLGGTDASSFSIVSSSGQLQTSAALDYEMKTSYSVTVTAYDGNSGGDSITVTINVTDVAGAAPSTQTPPAIPDNTALLSNFPNPFNPETWIPYQLAKPADVTLTIYDVRGVVVRELRLGHKVAGVYTSRSRASHWDGRNAFGEKVATGVYFYTLTAGEFTATRKLLIAK